MTAVQTRPVAITSVFCSSVRYSDMFYTFNQCLQYVEKDDYILFYLPSRSHTICIPTYV